MKKYQLFLIVTIVFNSQAFAQQDTEEEKTAYRLEGYAEFNEINSRRQLFPDSVYTTGKGFLIKSDYFVTTINGTQYVVVTYPQFKKGTYSSRRNLNIPSPSPLTVYDSLGTKNGKMLCIPKAIFDTLVKTPQFSVSFWNFRNYHITGGQLTLPFKLRGKQNNQKFQMTTDVTIGAYVGLRKRISRERKYYFTVPVTLGLTFININENSTSITSSSEIKSGIVPGFTWSTGLVLQFEKVNIGLVLGKDYASKVAEDWIYHNKLWYSFAIGFSFLN